MEQYVCPYCQSLEYEDYKPEPLVSEEGIVETVNVEHAQINDMIAQGYTVDKNFIWAKNALLFKYGENKKIGLTMSSDEALQISAWATNLTTDELFKETEYAKTSLLASSTLDCDRLYFARKLAIFSTELRIRLQSAELFVIGNSSKSDILSGGISTTGGVVLDRIQPCNVEAEAEQNGINWDGNLENVPLVVLYKKRDEIKTAGANGMLSGDGLALYAHICDEIKKREETTDDEPSE